VIERLSGLEDELTTLEATLADPTVFADQNRLRTASRRHKELLPVVETYRAYRARQADLDAAREMFADASGRAQEMRARSPRPRKIWPASTRSSRRCSCRVTRTTARG
jgi:peptide chain release factor 1